MFYLLIVIRCNPSVTILEGAANQTNSLDENHPGFINKNMTEHEVTSTLRITNKAWIPGNIEVSLEQMHDHE